jgi:hypothetical protein
MKPDVASLDDHRRDSTGLECPNAIARVRVRRSIESPA